MQSFLARIFIIAFCLLMGIGFMVFGIRNHSLGKESTHWPTTEGVLVSESASSKKKRARIFYEYKVNGITYKNSRVNYQDDKSSKKRIRDQYDVGDKLTVHYKPDDPEQSVLEPGASRSGLALRLLAGVFCFCLSVVFLFARRR